MEETKVEDVKVTEGEKTKKKRFKLRLIHLILVALLLIILVMGIILYSGAKYFLVAIYKNITEKYYNNGVNDTIESYEGKKAQKEQDLIDRKTKMASLGNLDIESSFVKKLYNKILKSNDIAYENEGSFYRTNKSTLETLSDSEKLIATLTYLKSKKTEFVDVYELEDEILLKLTHYDERSPEYSVMDLQIFTQEDLENATKELFGKKVELKCKTLDGCSETCDYIDGKYYCYRFEGGGYGYYHNVYTQIQYATRDSDKAYIYDKLLYVRNLNYEIEYEDGTKDFYDTYHRNFDENFFKIQGIDYNLGDVNGYENRIDDLYSELYLYKHTFQEDENGNYYWVSTEKIEE